MTKYVSHTFCYQKGINLTIIHAPKKQLHDVYDKYADEYEDSKVYIREKGKSLYRLVVEMNGKREYAPIADDIPLGVVYEHIQKVREVHRCYKIPAYIWLEHYIYGVWSRWF